MLKTSPVEVLIPMEAGIQEVRKIVDKWLNEDIQYVYTQEALGLHSVTAPKTEHCE